MKIQHHHLKCESEFYRAIEKGEKAFEVRKNDRNFRIYDMVYLEETVNGVKTGRTLGRKEIIYILHGGQYGVEEGYCVLQLETSCVPSEELKKLQKKFDSMRDIFTDSNVGSYNFSQAMVHLGEAINYFKYFEKQRGIKPYE